MADFVAILSKTIDGLGERDTAEMRQRVYERARKAIADKLAAIVPAPSKAQTDRQYKLLDDAIDTIEKRYVVPAVSASASSADPLADFLASVDDSLAVPAAPAPVAKTADAFRQSNFPPFPGAMREPMKAADQDKSRPDHVAANGMSGTAAQSGAAVQKGPEVGLDATDTLDALASPAKRMATDQAGSGAKGAIFALLGLLLIGGAGYAGYVYKDKILGTATGTQGEATAPVDGTSQTSPTENANAAAPAGTQGTAPASEAPAPKMTQRLTPDGQEIDAGPGTPPQDVGEGSSIASATTPSGTTPASGQPADAGQQQAVAVGEKAIFYEEKTGTEAGTADQGSIVWSVVQDSPGLDQPPEPAIRGEVTIPDKKIALRMTIKRNLDKSLPASHIIEMLFSTPADFTGGAIENVSRFSMKDTEQSPGNPLVGVPASFGDGFFLIALTDEKSAIDTNLQLIERQEWIDIPVAYKTGRRALLSFEKGLAGDAVFKEVLAAWKAKEGSAPADAPAANGG